MKNKDNTKKKKKYKKPTKKYYDQVEKRLAENMLTTFAESITATMEFLESEEAQEYYQDRQERITLLLEQSLLRDKWQDIIDRRANEGVNITDEIYRHVRNMNNPDAELISFAPRETTVFNKLCDYNYELIRDVTTTEINEIRKKLINDYAEGVQPLETSLLEIQLKPIRGWTLEYRAQVIARTESARAINTATLEQYRQDEIEYVHLDAIGRSCDECKALSKMAIPLDEASKFPVIHPNCRCSFSPIFEDDLDNYKKYKPV